MLIRQAEERNYRDCFESVQKSHKKLFIAAEILETPAVFVNGYSLPKEYQVKDISYFIDVLKNNFFSHEYYKIFRQDNQDGRSYS